VTGDSTGRLAGGSWGVPDRRTARRAICATARVHVVRIALSTAGDDLRPAGFARAVASRLHLWVAIVHSPFQGAAMKTDTFASISPEQLAIPSGGIDPAAQWIMMHESGGSPTAGHLHAQGRGDGTPGNHSSAFGAFQMIESTRKHYMGADYQSANFAKQYSAATHYVTDRYGSWGAAQGFWKAHHWY
jgi:hypothetical protein